MPLDEEVSAEIINTEMKEDIIIHGDRKNKRKGGTCAEFFKMNNRTECCTSRDDECFVTNFDSVCYCDIFCHSAFNDCCSDVQTTCMNYLKDENSEIGIQSVGEEYELIKSRKYKL